MTTKLYLNFLTNISEEHLNLLDPAGGVCMARSLGVAQWLRDRGRPVWFRPEDDERHDPVDMINDAKGLATGFIVRNEDIHHLDEPEWEAWAAGVYQRAGFNACVWNGATGTFMYPDGSPNLVALERWMPAFEAGTHIGPHGYQEPGQHMMIGQMLGGYIPDPYHIGRIERMRDALLKAGPLPDSWNHVIFGEFGLDRPHWRLWPDQAAVRLDVERAVRYFASKPWCVGAAFWSSGTL